MPLVKVNLLKGRSAEEKDSIAASIQTALVSTLGVPDADRYQLFNEYDGQSFRHTSGYLGMTYTDQLLIIEITFLEGRDDEVKKSLLAEINRNLVAAGVVGDDDVFVLITEIGRANVSLARGSRSGLRPRSWPVEPSTCVSAVISRRVKIIRDQEAVTSLRQVAGRSGPMRDASTPPSTSTQSTLEASP